VLHNSCNTGTHGLPDMSTLSPRACGPRASGVHIRQTTRACVTTVTYTISTTMHACGKTYNFIVNNKCTNHPMDLYSIHYVNMVPAMIDKPYMSKSAAACG